MKWGGNDTEHSSSSYPHPTPIYTKHHSPPAGRRPRAAPPAPRWPPPRARWRAPEAAATASHRRSRPAGRCRHRSRFCAAAVLTATGRPPETRHRFESITFFSLSFFASRFLFLLCEKLATEEKTERTTLRYRIYNAICILKSRFSLHRRSFFLRVCVCV